MKTYPISSIDYTKILVESSSIEFYSEENIEISGENDKTVNIDGTRSTTIRKEQKDDVTGDSAFYYRAKRTTTVDKEETTIFNNSQTETIKNGRKLDITSGGDTVTIKDGRTTNIDGTELHHVAGKLTEKYDSGQETTIAAGGRTESITGSVTVEVETGNWTQDVKSGEITIKSPNKIKLISEEDITLEAPAAKFEPKLHSFSMTGFNESITGVGSSFTITSASIALTSVSFNPASFNMTGSKISNNPVPVHYDDGFKLRAAGCEWDNLTMSIQAAAAFMFI